MIPEMKLTVSDAFMQIDANFDQNEIISNLLKYPSSALVSIFELSYVLLQYEVALFLIL